MITPEILDYIKSERGKQVPDSTIQSNLLINGWTQSDINEAFAFLANPVTAGASLPPVAVPLATATASTTPSSKPIVDKVALHKYRRERMWTIFIACSIVGLVIGSLGGGIGMFFVGSGLLWSLLYLILILASSYIASRGARPQDKTWKAVIDLIFGIIATLALSFVLGFVALFAYCLINPPHF